MCKYLQGYGSWNDTTAKRNGHEMSMVVINHYWNESYLRDELYGDVIMIAMASQITSLTIVYSIVYSGADQRKHQRPASLAFVRGIHRWPVNSPHKRPVTRKMFPFDDVIIQCGPSTWELGHPNCKNDQGPPWVPSFVRIYDTTVPGRDMFHCYICLIMLIAVPSIELLDLPSWICLGNIQNMQYGWFSPKTWQKTSYSSTVCNIML